MATFAEIDVFFKVIQVLVVDDKDTQDMDGNEDESFGAEMLHKEFGGTWLRTSRNTKGGVHFDGGTPFRKNYALKGMIYDKERDAFIMEQPYPSWTLNTGTCVWEPPIPKPSGRGCDWNEATQKWDWMIPDDEYIAPEDR